MTALVAALAVAICILAWIVAAQQIRFERENALRAATVHNDDRALMLQQYVSRTLATANLAALHVARLHALGVLAPGDGARPSRIDDPIARDPAFLGLSVVDERGAVVASTLGDTGLSPNVGGHPAFAIHRARSSGGLFVSKPVQSRILRSPTIWLTRRLDHPDGRFAGVVAINMAPAQLTAIFGRSGVRPTQSAWVVGQDGVIRSRLTGGVVSFGQDVAHGAVFRLQKQVDRGRFVGPGTLDGKTRLISHRRVPGYPLFVSYSELEDEVLRDVRARARLFTVGAGLVTAATLMIAALVLLALRQRERRALDLAASNARLEEAQRIARVGDWSRRFSDERVVWSPQLYEMYERDPALGPMREEFRDLIADESLQRMRAAIAQMRETGAPVSWEMMVRLPSGRTAHHLVHAVPTRDAEGRVTGYHGATQDVTELKKLEALQDELAHLSRVGAMNALTATLSHELNQPLTAAGNYLSAAKNLASRIVDPMAEQVAALVMEAQGQVIRAGDIIQRMRNLVTKGATTRSVLSMDGIIDEALAMISVTRACPHPIEVDSTDDDLLVLADAVQIQQVILNLVRNACEAQKDGDAPPPRIEVSTDMLDRVVVSVIDHGPGIPEEVLKRLFEPFASSKQSGLGLGLSISRTIVEAHGGTMDARNAPAGGAVMSFTLPLHGRRARTMGA